MKKITLAVAAALALGAAPAMAQDSGFYAGVGVGTYGIEENDVVDTLDFDENDTGFRVFGGWQFNKYFALEGGYNAGPEPSGTLGDIATLGGEADVSIEVNGFDLFAIGTWPIGESFYAFAKAGMIAWDADFDAEIREDDGEGGVITTLISDDASG
jgi:OOP family OmpA-OmpF porin